MIKNIKSISLLLFALFPIFNISVFANQTVNSYWDIQRKGANIFNQHLIGRENTIFLHHKFLLKNLVVIDQLKDWIIIFMI